MTDKIDHLEKLGKPGLLATQFQGSENLKATIAILLSKVNELEPILCDVAELLDIDNATGAQLDIVGDIVGQPRVFIPNINPKTFTFDVGPGFDVGCFLLNDGFLTLTDDEYRRWLRARIVRNAADISGEGIIRNFKFIFGQDTEIFFQDGNTQYVVSIGAALTLADRYLLDTSDLIPRTAAVNGMYGVFFDEDSFRFDIGPGFDTGLFPTEI